MPRRRKPNAGLGNRKAKKARRQEPVHPTPRPGEEGSDIVVTSEEIVNNVDDRADKRSSSAKMTQEKMSAISFLFVHKYDGLRSGVLESGWGGRYGIINCIRKDLGICTRNVTRNSVFQDIFLNLIECARTGCSFSIPEMIESNKGHRHPIIASDSPQAQIIADYMESGLSIEKTYQLLNEHEYEQGNEKISKSAVYNLVQRLKPKVIHVQKRKQGSNNPRDDWCRARYLFAKQILMRFGRLSKPFPRQLCFNLRLIGSFYFLFRSHKHVFSLFLSSCLLR